MPKFHVYVPEVHYQIYVVEANTPEDAARLARDGGGGVLDGTLEYSHTEEPDSYQVLNVETNQEYYRVEPSNPSLVDDEED